MKPVTFNAKQGLMCHAAALLLLAGALATPAGAAFVAYDDFGGASLDTNKWDIVRSSGTDITVSGGQLAITGNTDYPAIRSKQAFPVGTTLRMVVSTATGTVVFGTNSQTNTSSGAAVDAMYVRNDGGFAGYASEDNIANGIGFWANVGGTGAGTFDFVFGTTTLEIWKNGSPLGSIARPVNFDQAQRFEVVLYPGATIMIDEVSYFIPEPASLWLLGLAGLGLLGRRRGQAHSAGRRGRVGPGAKVTGSLSQPGANDVVTPRRSDAMAPRLGVN